MYQEPSILPETIILNRTLQNTPMSPTLESKGINKSNQRPFLTESVSAFPAAVVELPSPPPHTTHPLSQPVSYLATEASQYQLIELVLCFEPGRPRARGANGFQLGLCVGIKSSSGKVAAKSNHLVRVVVVVGQNCRAAKCEAAARGDETLRGGGGVGGGK